MSKVKPGRALINNTKTKYDKKENINPVYRDYIEKIPKEGYIKSVGKLESIFLHSVGLSFKRQFLFLLQLYICGKEMFSLVCVCSLGVHM